MENNILTQEEFEGGFTQGNHGIMVVYPETHVRLLRSHAAALERIRALTEGYASFDKIMKELSARWDSDEDSNVGKILNALSGHLTNYRTDITELRALVPCTPEGSGA